MNHNAPKPDTRGGDARPVARRDGTSTTNSVLGRPVELSPSMSSPDAVGHRITHS
jgi:hypothetical protein